MRQCTSGRRRFGTPPQDRYANSGDRLLRAVILVLGLLIGIGYAAERQREFTNKDVERVIQENPGLTAQPQPARAATVYRCKRLSGSITWADRPCHTIEASTTDIFYVPAHLPFGDRVREAENAYRIKYPAVPPLPSGPTAQQRFDECLDLKKRLSDMWGRSRQAYVHLSVPLKKRQEQLGCDP